MQPVTLTFTCSCCRHGKLSDTHLTSVRVCQLPVWFIVSVLFSMLKPDCQYMFLPPAQAQAAETSRRSRGYEAANQLLHFQSTRLL